ncbi:phosphonate ABC transporter ATP-binding protein [Pseudoalteromonas luteoviolacea]|uniref:Phosphonate ABC transporter ATP-binding protein n=1 Tax=Pseudoalteromonas luteoviolacea TaxID=43657 RepID=A0A0C1Q4Q6_9GAMM|nr:ABC transporter ATP-binding protein [Pseudoalteromonas luteoviolacea]KID55546.1 phosphonate ABC transporter ATP-binding protein [Pseudoalteromonas luteoviolacea]
MINIQQLGKEFRTDSVITKALNGINLEIESGEFVSIMGPSGCGKSTLLSILGMLDSPSNGQYQFIDESIEKFSESQLAALRKQHLGFVFQSFNLIDELTVYENVELPLKYQGVNKDVRQQRVTQILEKVDIAHRAAHFPQQLSGGQQQRVAVARALVINPKLILADEPTGNLDSKNSLEVMSMLQQLNQEGATIVMVTHSEEDAEYGSRIIRLHDGQIVSDQAAQKVQEMQYAS